MKEKYKRNLGYAFAIILALIACYFIHLTWLQEYIKDKQRTEIFFELYGASADEKKKLLKNTKSQIAQDIFVYLESGKKTHGYFVEFGATNGVSLSNTYMLEQEFGWRGILAEPARIWHRSLLKNRPNTSISTECVWKESGQKLNFKETSKPGLSTIEQFVLKDMNSVNREEGKYYVVSTISLLDLLKRYNAPQNIDYLSIDTEGSELEILQSFFRENNYYKINIITCEHNFTSYREEIYNLLVSKGYKRKLEDFSEWDDFYVLQSDY